MLCNQSNGKKKTLRDGTQVRDGASPTTSLLKYHASPLERKLDPNILLSKMG